ncbi:unnamed protein product, partial [Adineta steineri]
GDEDINDIDDDDDYDDDDDNNNQMNVNCFKQEQFDYDENRV